MPSGEVLRFNPAKKYGFIRPDSGGEDVMLHESALCPGEDPSWVRPGVRVSFEVQRSPRGLRASNVRAWQDGYAAGDVPVIEVTPAARFRDEISEVMAGAVSQIEDIARRLGWVD